MAKKLKVTAKKGKVDRAREIIAEAGLPIKEEERKGNDVIFFLEGIIPEEQERIKTLQINLEKVPGINTEMTHT